jgi:rhodanese-related sulfurtransferase
MRTGRVPTQLPGMPMGTHDSKRVLDPKHPELFVPCRCGGCSFTAAKDKVVKTSVGK